MPAASPGGFEFLHPEIANAQPFDVLARFIQVPEVVPFRLTQMIVAALGLTGLNGLFRHAARATMDLLRRARHDLQVISLRELWQGANFLLVI